MARRPWILRRIVIGVVIFALTLGGFLLQPAGTLAGIGTSPGSTALASQCTSGEHIKEPKLVTR